MIPQLITSSGFDPTLVPPNQGIRREMILWVTEGWGKVVYEWFNLISRWKTTELKMERIINIDFITSDTLSLFSSDDKREDFPSYSTSLEDFYRTSFLRERKSRTRDGHPKPNSGTHLPLPKITLPPPTLIQLPFSPLQFSVKPGPIQTLQKISRFTWIIHPSDLESPDLYM